MKIGVLGTSVVGQTISRKLAAIGYNVVVGMQNVVKKLARPDQDSSIQPPFSAWLGKNPGNLLLSYAEAARYGEMIVNTTSVTAH
jgi:predicted dinucleotide-binding enzyme